MVFGGHLPIPEGISSDEFKLDRASSLARVLAAAEPAPALPISPYTNLTMKQLVVKALTEHFQNGATSRQMLDFFRDAWGRIIERQNLSPQLTRLYQEGVIGRIPSIGGWFLIPQTDKLGKRRPYLHSGAVVWMFPEQANDQCELLLTRESLPLPAVDADED
jgi:hypothetical protein